MAFETCYPLDCPDLIQRLRENEDSMYMQCDALMFTCAQNSIAEILERLD